MERDGLVPQVLWKLGRVEVTTTVIYSLITSGILIAVALVVRAGLRRQRSGWVVAVEFVVEHMQEIMRDMFQCDPSRYTPLVVTLALFIGTANLLGLVPGMRSPTADFSTTAALAALVFFAV